jgi:hypothetical protein
MRTLRLDIEGRDPKDAMLIQGLEHIRSLDDRGRALRSPDFASPAEWIRSRAEKQTRKREVIGLQQESDAKALQTLEGELVVGNGMVRTFTFGGDDLHRGVSRRSGGGPCDPQFDKTSPWRLRSILHLHLRPI